MYDACFEYSFKSTRNRWSTRPRVGTDTSAGKTILLLFCLAEGWSLRFGFPILFPGFLLRLFASANAQCSAFLPCRCFTHRILDGCDPTRSDRAIARDTPAWPYTHPPFVALLLMRQASERVLRKGARSWRGGAQRARTMAEGSCCPPEAGALRSACGGEEAQSRAQREVSLGAGFEAHQLLSCRT